MITIGERVRIMRGFRENEWGVVVYVDSEYPLYIRVELDKGSWCYLPESYCKTLAQLKQMVADGEL